jgi:hypothetical protein
MWYLKREARAHISKPNSSLAILLTISSHCTQTTACARTLNRIDSQPAMPRKDNANTPASAQAQQDAVSEGIENFELPRALVTRIAKSAVRCVLVLATRRWSRTDNHARSQRT